jgi:hypothetical protein
MVMLNVYNLTNAKFMDSGWWNSSDGTNPGYFGFTAGAPINFLITSYYKF